VVSMTSNRVRALSPENAMAAPPTTRSAAKTQARRPTDPDVVPVTEQNTNLLIERTALLAENAAVRGDTDVLPRSVEFRILRGYPRELAEAVWRADGLNASCVEAVEVPLSRLTTRDAHLLDPVSFLRLGGATLAVADAIEEHRFPKSVATSVRWAPNRSRARIMEVGSFRHWEVAMGRIRSEFPSILIIDVALCFPSLREDAVHRAVARWSRQGADLVRAELVRIGVTGLPVGCVSSRILAEAVLHDVDRDLVRGCRSHVRRMDDLAIGVRDASDASYVRGIVAEALRPYGLHLNKAKTKLVSSGVQVDPRLESSVPLRTLLQQDDPDRLQLSAALRDARDEAPAWDGRRRARLLTRLAGIIGRLPVCVGGALRTIQTLLPGTSGLDAASIGPVRTLLASRVALHRAQGASFLGQNDPDSVPVLRTLATGDPSALVRREAITSLIRLEARAEVAGVLARQPLTELDRSAWIVASGVLGCTLPFEPTSPFSKLLHRAAREHQPSDLGGPVIRSHRSSRRGKY
jgi:hypothetical protein